MERLVYIAIFAAALGSGLVAGIFFAFSTFVMGALGRLPQAAGISRDAIDQCRGDQSGVPVGLHGHSAFERRARRSQR